MESSWRLIIFVSVFFIMWSWEKYNPLRPIEQVKSYRRTVNLTLAVFTMLLMRLSFGASSILLAQEAQLQGMGLLKYFQVLSVGQVLISIIMLDLAIYWQHRLFHQWAGLWRLHEVHHSDLDFDVTTALRFHPLEIVLSMGYKLALILILGISPLAVLVFEIGLNASALFNHSNIRLPVALERVVRLILVTPAMHRIHHSILPTEQATNFGFCLSCWDRLFGTYQATAQGDQTTMLIGVARYRTPAQVNFVKCLLMPFTKR
jgi:sterol desaturase/sphingolipid hydroxylase (fatty acid hydroxylase superfamily)